MSELISIQNFGPIKKIDLEFKKVNVLIGEQGTGKSALAKLLYVISSQEFLTSKEKRSSIIELYGLFFKRNTQIHYTTKDYQVKFNKGLFDVKFSDTIEKDVENEMSKIKKTISKEDYSIFRSWNYFTNWIQKEIGSYQYVPAERIALFTALRFMLNTSNRSVYKNNFDQYILDFADLYNIASEKILDYEIPHLENVAFKKTNGFDKVEFKGDSLFLYQTSSGFQVSIPLVIFFEYFNSSKRGANRFIIEEPELNLFPTAQYKLIQFFIEKINRSGNSLLITTHSPYILTSLNNLLQAHVTGVKKGNSIKVSKLINKKNWLNPNDVSAYMLLPNGRYENIFDSKENLIRAEMIDSVSTIINNEFDELLRIDLGLKSRANV